MDGDVLRHLEVGDLLLDRRHERAGLDRRVRAWHDDRADPLPQGRLRDAHYGDVGDAVEGGEGVLDLGAVEAYSFDAVSQLGYLAAVTERVEITSGILQIFSRTPAALAMTAAGLDYVSEGRFALGLGASGPQVVEGFHGVRYDAPLGRTREVIEICRQVWRREKLTHSGRHFQVPLPPGQGTGLGKPLKLIDRPVRDRIPVTIAAIGPKNVALAAEIAEGWEPIFFHPEKAAEAWGAAVADGRSRRDGALGELDVRIAVPTAITEHPEPLLDAVRPQLALYIGGMGAPGKNFYNDLARRYGYEAQAARIQDLYLDGHVQDATTAVPDELVRAVTLIGPRSFVADRLGAMRDAGSRRSSRSRCLAPTSI